MIHGTGLNKRWISVFVLILILALTAFVVAGCSSGASGQGESKEGISEESGSHAEEEERQNKEQNEAQESSLRDVKDPRQLFVDNCGACHGHDGSGVVGPELRNTTLSMAQIKAVIESGGQSMPEFKGGELSTDQIAAVALYVKDELPKVSTK